MYGKDDLLRQLEQIGVSPEATVMVHTSVKSVGSLENGGDTLLDALMEYFRPGLLLLPTHTWDKVGSETMIYDPLTSPPCVGILPKLLLQRKEAHRSLHPTHSIAAVGRRAEEYIQGEEDTGTPAPPFGCWGRLYEEKATILLIGVGQNRNTYLHGVEEYLDIPERLTPQPQEITIRLPDGFSIQRMFRRHYNSHTNDVSQYYVKMEPAFRQGGALRDGRLGDATVQICDAVQCREIMEEVHRHWEFDPFIDDRPMPESWYQSIGR